MLCTTVFGKKLCSRRFFLSLLFFVFLSFGALAQEASIVFWNVENLYDTVPSPFYDDREFTSTERYNTKITNLARVLDELAADVVGLAEVENEEVVRGLVEKLGTDYNYIHRTSNDSRGIDQVLLYKGDKFFPEHIQLIQSGTRREFLHVEGELMEERVHFIVCHLSSNLNSPKYRENNLRALRKTLEGLLSEDPAARIVVMGDMNATPNDKLVRKTLGSVESPYDFVHTPHWADYDAGRGSYNFRGRWYLYDWMLVSPAIARTGQLRAGVYAKEYLTEPAPQGGRRPIRNFSDHFPVYIVISK